MRPLERVDTCVLLGTLDIYVRAGRERHVDVYVYVRACVRYVVTSGRGSKRQRGERGPWGVEDEAAKSDGRRAGVAVGRSVGGWSGRVRRIARVVQCG